VEAFIYLFVAGVFVIVDTSAPMFDLNLPQQLNKDLIMNMYIDRKGVIPASSAGELCHMHG